MKLFLTNGMFGDHLKQIGDDTDDVKRILEHIFAWKHNDDNCREYKVESYDRLIFDDKNNRIAIDFGDYMTFMLIEDVSLDERTQFMNV